MGEGEICMILFQGVWIIGRLKDGAEKGSYEIHDPRVVTTVLEPKRDKQGKIVFDPETKFPVMEERIKLAPPYGCPPFMAFSGDHAKYKHPVTDRLILDLYDRVTHPERQVQTGRN